ncbi:MAG: 50S ribosomal protein L11 methyltransferase [Myxococcaceae bacterium]
MPLCPELTLLQAESVFDVWSKVEAAVGKQVEPPFWAFGWPGGQALARYLIDRPELVRGKRVLDFGSGSGLCGIGAVKSGAQVTAVELDPLAAAATKLNAALNQVHLEAKVANVVGADEGWDLVLAGDVFYERAPSGAIATWLAKLAARGATVLIGDPGRAFLPTGLTELLRYHVHTSVDWEGVPERDPRVLQMK